MQSLKRLAKQGWFERVSDLSVFPLMIIAGFMVTTASAFWTFTTWGDRNPPLIQQASAMDSLVCECRLAVQPASASADDIEQPAFDTETESL